MIPCRSFFFLSLDCARSSTNVYATLRSLKFSQVCSLRSNPDYKWIMDGLKNRGNIMDQRRQKSATPIWRPVHTQSSSSGESVVDGLKMEAEELRDANKNEIIHAEGQYQEAHLTISSAASDAENLYKESYVTEPADTNLCSWRSSAPYAKKHSSSLLVGASLMCFIKGKRGTMQQTLEEEMGVKIIFPLSRNEDYLLIEGMSAESVNKASEKIKSIIEEVINSSRLDYSHFISLPLAVHSELVDKLFSFQRSILGASNSNKRENLEGESNRDTSKSENNTQMTCGGSEAPVALKIEDDGGHVKVDLTKMSRVNYPPKQRKTSEPEASKKLPLPDSGIDKSIFINPETFHLTVLMLKLWNRDRLAAATEVLQNVSSKVLDALDRRPISIRLKGLDLMKGSAAEARVLYAPVEEVGGEGRLELACQIIIDAFVEAGLVLERDSQHKLKMHATIMNARHRKCKWGMKGLDTFDARAIFKQYGSEDWGEYLIGEAHLSQRFVYDANGYYRCCCSIPLPETVPTD